VPLSKEEAKKMKQQHREGMSGEGCEREQGKHSLLGLERIIISHCEKKAVAEACSCEQNFSLPRVAPVRRHFDRSWRDNG
jgi:hypothetical protein